LRRVANCSMRVASRSSSTFSLRTGGLLFAFAAVGTPCRARETMCFARGGWVGGSRASAHCGTTRVRRRIPSCMCLCLAGHRG
jgi:hypothetical protein